MLAANNNNLEMQLHEILKDYSAEVRIQVEHGLNDASRYLRDKLASVSPRSSNSGTHLADTWIENLQYKSVRYVGATKTVPRPKYLSYQKGGIPLSSLLEFGSKGHPFIESTFESSIPVLQALIARKIGG